MLQLVLSGSDRADAGLAVVSLAWLLLSWYRSCEGKLREVAGECHLFMARDVPYCEAVKRACLPRATHCLCRAMAPAGVTEGPHAVFAGVPPLATLAQVEAACEGEQTGECQVVTPHLAVLVQEAIECEMMRC